MGELIPKEEDFQLVDFKTIKTNIAENFEGLEPQFITVTIPAGGGTTFEIDEDEAVKAIEGVIIDHYAIRALFLNKFGEGEKTPPVCFSMDGVKGEGLGADEGTGSCYDCKYNKWGSYQEYVDETDTSNRKACAEKHRVFVLRSGELLPLLITFPVTSIRPLSLYMTKLASKGKNYKTVITRISLEKKTKGDIPYSVAVFKFVKDIPEDKVEEIKAIAAFLKPYCRNKPIEDEIAEDDIGF